MSQQSRALPAGLIALALGGFGIGLTEFGIVGLLPEIAADFGVTKSVAGYLISGYALTVAIGAIILTGSVSGIERKRVLVSLMVLFILGNAISAIAPSYAVMVIGRVVAALCHGAFFGVGAVVAADMVAENRRAGAISLMFAGLTVAMVVGIPLGTLLGQQMGWRSTFWAITVIGIVTLVGIQLLVSPSPAAKSNSLWSEIGIFGRPQVLLSAAVSILTFGALVGAFTYIAFILTEVTGFAASAVPWLLLLFGVGSFIGNLIGGRVADRALNTSLIAILFLLTAVLAGFGLTAANTWAAIAAMFLLGTIGFAAAPGLQLRIMQFASDAPTMSSGANIAALNVGNAFGAWLGGLAIAAGLGLSSPLWVGAGLAATALLVLTLTSAASKRTSQASAAASASPDRSVASTDTLD